MKLKFKHQKFQADASKAICDVFAGQPKLERQKYRKDIGTSTNDDNQMTIDGEIYSTKQVTDTGYSNALLQISDTQILENIKRVQRGFNLKPDDELQVAKVKIKNESTKKTETVSMKYNLTVEMETGTGKTYTYIKTMYDLNARFGWTKFIIIVPSVAIREGVYKSFQVTQEHFSEEYGKKIRFFIRK